MAKKKQSAKCWQTVLFVALNSSIAAFLLAL